MSKYGMLVQIAVAALPLFIGGLKLGKAGLDKLGAMKDMKSLKAEADKSSVKTTVGKDGREYHSKDGKRISADEASKIKSMQAPGGKTGGGMMSKLGGVAKAAGGIMAFANVATTAFSAFQTQQEQQAIYDKAKATGDKKAMAEARANQGEAVGGAVGSNPVPLVIGCHRVMGASGKITGYSGGKGIPTKQWLLDHEGIPSK
jgi:O-6-methylguanine DNA methyltransferase